MIARIISIIYAFEIDESLSTLAAFLCNAGTEEDFTIDRFEEPFYN